MLQTTLRITNSSDIGVTGLTDANIKFRRDPFGVGDVIASVEVSGGTNGIYLIDFIGIPYQTAQLWIDGVYQTDWGTKYVGDIIADLNGQVFKNAGAATANGHLTRYEQVVRLTSDQTIAGVKTFSSAPKSSVAAAATTELVRWDEALKTTDGIMIFSGNVLIVDAALTPDVTGRRYNTIQEAIDYANTQSPTGSNRWTIYIVPHKNNSSLTGYAENLTLYKYIDLIGLGMVLISGSVTVSGTWTGGTFARLKNLFFYLNDVNYLARGQEIYNSHFLVFEDLSTPTVACENSQFFGCGFWQYNVAVTTLITSSGDNKFIGCYTNDDVTAFIGSDKQIGFDMLDDPSTYFAIT